MHHSPDERASAGQHWTVLAAAKGAVAGVELRRYTLPRPNEMWEVDDAPILSIVQPRPEGTEGEVMFGLDGRRHRVGRLMLRPAGIAMHSRGNGGVLDILTCRFDPARFADATGLHDWDARRLERCAAIVSPSIAALAVRLRRETLEAGFGSALAIDALTDLLMVDLARLIGDGPARQGTSGGLALWQVRRIEDALHAAEGNWPSTLALAALCGISRSHLSRAFAATTGTALSDHAAAIRQERAQDMIRAGVLPMSSIAHILGFATASAFSAAFRRATGLTPRQFSQRHEASRAGASSTGRH